MKLQRLFFSALLCVTAAFLLLLATPTQAQADTEGYYTYSVSGGKATITSVDRSISGVQVIPSTLGGYPVTSIGEKAFYSRYSLISITIPNSVTSIGNGAFSCCERLTSVTIGNGVTRIGSSAFSYCFDLTSITIPDNVTSIGNYAFSCCYRLTSITIPDSVTSIDAWAFSWCDSLTGIWVDENNQHYASDTSGVLFNKGMTTLIQAPGGLKGVYTIPDSVTSIGNLAFSSCTSLTSVTIGNGVTSIGERAFSSCTSLTSVTIGNGVTSIGYDAFSYCNSLTGIWVDENNQHYASDTSGVLFNKGMTTLIRVPGGLKGVYTIPDSVTSIGEGAFASCDSLTDVTIGNGVTSIGYDAFSYCDSLTSITIPDSVTSIGYDAFSYCDSLNTVYYSSGQSQWSQISIGSDNSCLTSATIHYNHVHDYTVLPVTTVEASCTADGYREYTCVYGETYRETIPMIAHTTGNDAVVTPPTCEVKGYTTSTCPDCKQVVQTEFVGALGHDYRGTVTVVPPSCTEQGYTDTQCTRCDSVSKTKFDALDHDYNGTVTVVPPSCTEQGYTGTQCTRCDSVSKTKFVDALDHDYNGTVTVVPPKCTEEGYTLTQCIRCDSTQKSDITKPSGHKMVAVPAVEATCTKVGLTMGTACERCGMVGVAQTETPSLGHNYIENICATCEHKFGDVDYNEVINVDDALLLLLYVCMPGEYELDADLDGNGDVDARDVSILLLHVSMPDQFPLQPAKKEEL